MLRLISCFKTNVLKGFNNVRYFASVQSQIVDVNGQTINYVKVGNGPKNILCFPGAFGTIWSDFKPQIEGLDRKQFTVIAWDPPGYGFSRPPNRNFSTEFYRNDAETAYHFLKKINVEKVNLLGWSDGGISSMILSASYPEMVQKLIFWGSNSYVIDEEVKSYQIMRDLSQWSDKMKQPLIELYTEKGLEEMGGRWCDAMMKIHKNGGDICKSYLPKIKCPTLILHGDKDPMVAPEHPGYLLENISLSKIHRFPAGKHNIHLRYAEEFNNIVTDFILM